jgi:hypothetical protein
MIGVDSYVILFGEWLQILQPMKKKYQEGSCVLMLMVDSTGITLDKEMWIHTAAIV